MEQLLSWIEITEDSRQQTKVRHCLKDRINIGRFWFMWLFRCGSLTIHDKFKICYIYFIWWVKNKRNVEQPSR